MGGYPLYDGGEDAETATAQTIVCSMKAQGTGKNLQLRYGLDEDANGLPDDTGLTVNPATVQNWANVLTVEVNLLARNTEASTSYTDNKEYVLGDVTVTAPGDGFRRRAFSTTVSAVNPASLREQ